MIVPETPVFLGITPCGNVIYIKGHFAFEPHLSHNCKKLDFCGSLEPSAKLLQRYENYLVKSI